MSGTELEIPETLDANPPPPEDAPADRPLSAREQIMAGIIARREEQIQTENAQAAIYDADAREAGLSFPEDEPEPVEPEPRAAVPPKPVQQPPVTVPAAAAPLHRTVVVDGQQFAVTEQQADELIRLGMMANVALHQYQQPPAPQSAPAPEQPRPVVDPDAIRDAVRKLQYSGEDDAVEAFTQLVSGIVSRSAAPPIDQNAIVSRAVQEAQAQARLAADADLIRREYPEIFADPQRTMLAKLNVDAIRARDVATGIRRSDLEIYREAGNAVYNAIGRPLPGNEASEPPIRAPVAPVRQDVVERKRAAPRATQPIDMRAPSPAAPRPPSGSDIVDQIRRARGQQSMR